MRFGLPLDLPSRASGQSEPICPLEKVLDGGGMPPRSAARCAFVHGLELGCDLLQRAVGCRCLDAGDEPDQPVVVSLRLRPIQQTGLEQALGDEAANRAAQPFHRPGCRLAAVQHPHDVAPGLIGAHPPHDR